MLGQYQAYVFEVNMFQLWAVLESWKEANVNMVTITKHKEH